NASAIVPAPANPEHAPAQPVGLGNGFAPHWIGSNIPNNQNGWIEEEDPEEEEEDPKEEEEDPKEDPKEDPEEDPEEDLEEDLEEEPEEGDDEEEEMEVDDEENNSEVIDPVEPLPPVSQTMPHKRSLRGNPPPPLIQDTVNRMIQESVEATIRTERERVRNEANRAGGPNVAPVARECTLADFIKCNPITFRGNEGAVGSGPDMVELTSGYFGGMEAVTRKTWAEMKVMMTEEFCPPEEIQRMEYELWNLK
ncbi:hypothetical protein Tco_0292134, partial [Tanacetum coccineum]